MVSRSQGATTVAVCLTLLAACGSDARVVGCVDERCPEGQACGVGGECEPIDMPATIGDLGRHTSTALTSDGRLVVATYDSTYHNLVVLTERSPAVEERQVVDGWRIEQRTLVDTDSGRWTDIEIDDEDRLHAVWFDADAGLLRYGVRGATGGWTIEVVDGAGPEIRGTHASLCVHQGVVHIAYRDESARQLRYARRERNGHWTRRAVDGCAGEPGCPDESEDYGEFASIAVIGQLPRIAFYDRARGDLKMASRSADGFWETSVLDGYNPTTGEDSGDVGRFVSLALTPQRKPGLAYFDASRGALRYLVAGQAPVVVDDGVRFDEASQAWRSDPVGQHVRLRYDSAGRAIMLYLDGGGLRVKMAVVSGSQVVSVRVVEGLAPGGWFDFQVGADDLLRGAYGPWVVGEVPRTRLERFSLLVDTR